MQAVTPQAKYKQSIVDQMLRHGNVTKLRSALRFDETIDPMKQETTRAHTRLDVGDVPYDDKKPPAEPTGVRALRDSVTGMGRIEFDIPNIGDPDYVRRAQVRYRNVTVGGPGTWTVVEADPNTGSPPLDLTGIGINSEADLWEAQAQFVDFFGRESGWGPLPAAQAVEEVFIPYLRVEGLRSGAIKAEEIRLIDDPATATPSAFTLTDTSFLRIRDTKTTPGDPFDRVKISMFGVELQPLPELIQAPNVDVGSKIKPLGTEFAAIHFGSPASMRGIYFRADGSDTQDGVLRFDATPFLGADALTNSAYLVLRGITGAPNVARTGPDLEVERDLRVGRDATIPGNLTVGTINGAVAGGFSGEPEDLGEGVLAGGVDLQLLNFTDPAGVRIPEIVPLVSLRQGTLPARVVLAPGNFRSATGADLHDIVPLLSLIGGQLPIKVVLQTGNYRTSAGADIHDIVPLLSLRGDPLPIKITLQGGNFRNASGTVITELVPKESIESGAFADARIPNLAAGKTTSGVFDDARIPNLAAGKTTTGVFDDARIPSFAASKTTSGVFDLARIPVLPINTKTDGILAGDRIGKHGDGGHQVQYLKSGTDGGSHDNSAHANPGFSWQDHVHGGSVSTSLRFMLMPRSARRAVLQARETVLRGLGSGVYRQPELKALAVLLAGLTHVTIDGLTETAGERESRWGEYEALPPKLDATLWEMYETEYVFDTTLPVADPIVQSVHRNPDAEWAYGKRARNPRFVRETPPGLGGGV